MTDDISKKEDKLIDLLEDFLLEWRSNCEHFVEWEKATNEAELIFEYVVDQTRFEPNTFLAKEILNSFKELRSNIEINEKNIRDGLIGRKIRNVLNEEESDLSKELQRRIDDIERQNNNSIKEAIKDIYRSPNSIDIYSKYKLESEDINEFGFIGSDKQGKYIINCFYKENAKLKLFINSVEKIYNSPQEDLPIFWKNKLLQGGGLVFLLLACLFFFGYLKPVGSKILDLCSNSGQINCTKENDEIGNSNTSIINGIKKGNLKENQVYVIAVVIPDKNATSFVSKYILKGVARRQSEFNSKNDRKILVLVAKEDPNNQQQNGGLKIAQELVNQKIVLGVIGPYSSSSLSYVSTTYCNDHLSLISPTVNIPIKTLEKNPTIKHDCFFRVTGDNYDALDRIIKRLQRKHKRVLIIRTGGDAFSDSFSENFREKVAGRLLHDIGDEFYLNKSNDKATKNFNSIKSKQEIQTQIKAWAKSYKSILKETAILIIIDSKHLNLNPEEALSDIKNVISANNGTFLIVGSNPVYNPELLKSLEHDSFNLKLIENMIIAVPAFYPNYRPKSDDKDLNWYEAMSYDATQMLVTAISNESKHTTPTREGIYEQFKDKSFEVPKEEAYTGLIKLKGSDRVNPPGDLIYPTCRNNNCEWDKIRR
jgi:ABC-type branched-subunit amino acid transport system substrate-binding protein